MKDSLVSRDKKMLPNWPPKPSDGSGIKVLFINPPAVPFDLVEKLISGQKINLYQTVAMPMGILYLSSVLENTLPGIEIRIIDLAMELRDFTKGFSYKETSLDDFFIETISKAGCDSFKPDFVGISVLFSTAHKTVCHLARIVKKKWPDSPIVVGGMHAANAVVSLLNVQEIDYVCRGEGESIITDFAKFLHQKKDGELVSGIIGRKKMNQAIPGKIGLMESAPLIFDLDKIPFPAWHLLPMIKYVGGSSSRAIKVNTISQDGEATILTTRGCPFHCSFCASWTVHGRIVRYRSIENVLQEIEILHNRYNVNLFIPEDDLFTVKKSRIIELCNVIAKKFDGKLQFQFPNGLSVATLDEDVICGLIKMGMKVANIAIESGSDYVQKHIIKKNCDLDRARRIIDICRSKGIIVRAYFILGFPDETIEQINETINYSETISTDWNSYVVAAPLIGTEMFQQLLDRGYIDNSFNWDSAIFQERTFDTREISARDLKDLAYAANIRVNFFNSYNLRNGHYDRAISFYRQILDHYPNHLVAQYCIGLANKYKGDIGEYEKAMQCCKQMLAMPDAIMAHQLYDGFNDLLTDMK